MDLTHKSELVVDPLTEFRLRSNIGPLVLLVLGFLALLVLVLVVMAGCKPGPAPQPAPVPIAVPAPAPIPDPEPVPDWQTEMLNVHNQLRRQHGLAPLTLNNQLTKAAIDQANYMAEIDQPTHIGRHGSSPMDRIRQSGYSGTAFGENVAEGYPTVADVMQGWENSPPHLENILGLHFKDVGFAQATSSSGKPYWATDFGGSSSNRILEATPSPLRKE